jgi:hypothetical protein
MKLFCYVVDHDTGLAPNPNDRVCTLVYCKYKKPEVKRRNVVELAEMEDWIIGVGGKSKKSSGHGTIIYIMRVDEKLSFGEYLRRFPDRKRPVRLSSKDHGEFALISHRFLYFGNERFALGKVPGAHKFRLEKTGRGFRSKFPEPFIRQLADWVHKQHPRGKIGDPCTAGPDRVPGTTCRCQERPRALEHRCR